MEDVETRMEGRGGGGELLTSGEVGLEGRTCLFFSRREFTEGEVVG